MPRKDMQFFTYGKQIKYCGVPLEQSDFDEVKRVYKNYVVPCLSRENMYRSLWFVIASQAMPYERAVKFATYIKDSSIESAAEVFKHGRDSAFKLRWSENRFSPAGTYLKEQGGIEYVVEQLLKDPKATREHLVDNVRFMGAKTASFWYLSLGGNDELLTLDIHVMRQCAGLGISIPKSHYVGKKRQSGKSQGINIITTPSKNEYLQFEKEILEMVRNSPLMEKFPELSVNNHIHGGLLTTLFWWLSAKALRTKPLQIDLGVQEIWFKPYYHES